MKERLARIGPRRAAGVGVMVIVLAVALVFPLAVKNQQVATIAFLTLIFVTAAVAWNIFSSSVRMESGCGEDCSTLACMNLL